MFIDILLLVSVIFHMTDLSVSVANNDILWKPLIVSEDYATFTEKEGTLFSVASTCFRDPTCNLVCTLEEEGEEMKFFHAPESLDPEHCEDPSVAFYKCFTKNERDFDEKGVKEPDDLYYLKGDIAVSYPRAMQCCAQKWVNSFRLVIIRDSATFAVVKSYHGGRINFYIGLERDAATGEYIWHDGSAYDMSLQTPVANQGGNAFIMYQNKIDDIDGPHVFMPYLCQANRDGVPGY